MNAMSAPEIYLSSDRISKGDLILIRIKAEKGEKVRVKWHGKEIPLIPNQDATSWQGFLAADMDAESGHYKAAVTVSPSGYKKQLDIEVVDKDYGVRNLTLPEAMVTLDEETLKRVRRESDIINGLWKAPVSAAVWSGFFIRPIEGDVVGPFGTRSIINNQPRSPHTGVDIKGEEGAPVKAINDGKVILICDHFFTGRSLFLDHGAGIISMYFHLREIDVKEGDMVRRGQIIGLIGSTGRATGPHLHWGIRINGARINPLSLVDLSKEWEE
ncbi:MAG TPA: M23 family metallopeptidase [Desulfatiglandales bacterium]|nr:M23 family metallopeptidase [Desulfatiglandales bacterium]